jgi:hypothetical protein
MCSGASNPIALTAGLLPGREEQSHAFKLARRGVKGLALEARDPPDAVAPLASRSRSSQSKAGGSRSPAPRRRFVGRFFQVGFPKPCRRIDLRLPLDRHLRRFFDGPAAEGERQKSIEEWQLQYCNPDLRRQVLRTGS